MNEFSTVLILLIFVFVSYCGCNGNDDTQHPNCEGEGHQPGNPSHQTQPSGPSSPGNHPGSPGGPPGGPGGPPGGPGGPHGGPGGPHGGPGGPPGGPGGPPGGPGGPPGGPGGPPGGPGGPHGGPGGSHGNPGNPTGHFGGNINGKFTVVISFDSLDTNSGKFFMNQLKPIYKEFSECCYWQFIPCSTSHIVDDVLKCKDGVAECQIDVLHACAAHFYENDQHKLGLFFLCMMTCGNQYTSGEKCAKEAGMCWETLNKCQPSKDAGTFCDNRYKQLNALHEPTIPGVMYNYHYDKQAENESINNLKTGICNQIKKNNMQCAACGNTGGGHCPGGNSPGAPGGNSHDNNGHHGPGGNDGHHGPGPDNEHHGSGPDNEHHGSGGNEGHHGSGSDGGHHCDGNQHSEGGGNGQPQHSDG